VTRGPAARASSNLSLQPSFFPRFASAIYTPVNVLASALMRHRAIALSRSTAAVLAIAFAIVLQFEWSQASPAVTAAGLPRQAATVAAAPPDLSAAIDGIDKMVASEFPRDNLGSVTVGVVADKRLVWSRSYGYADMEKKVPATVDSVYRIGSITKQFTALMLLQLVERGKVRLSDPVEKFLPEVSQVRGRVIGAPPITLVQLATMTSGLDREPANLETYLKGPVSEWEKVLISALPETKYAFEPDTRYFYSNIGYAILGAALGRAAGQPYTEYVRQHIFAPLGMTHSAFEPNVTIASAIAKGYAVTRGSQPPTTKPGQASTAQAWTIDAETPTREHEGRGYKVPNGAIYTTVGDLARFVAFELGAEIPAVLKKTTQEDNYSRVNSADGALRSGYGIGFQLTREGDTVVYGHGGSVAGYTAAAHFERTSRTGVIVLRNAGGGAVNVGQIALRAIEMLATARKKAPTTP
jgi:CubicO group peptidase (beta-lactamase class C family)